MPPPPRASLQGIPPELRNEIFHLVDVSTPMRIVSAAKLVTAYQEAQPEWQTNRANVSKWQKTLACGPDHTNAQSPMSTMDLSTLLDLSTALHPLSRTSRQLYAEYRPTHVQTLVSRYRFKVHNFDMTQTEVASIVINTLGINEWRMSLQKLPFESTRYEFCFIADDDAISSARAMCETIQQTNDYPSGFFYMKFMGFLSHVTTTLKQEQKQEICDMVEAMVGQTLNERHSVSLRVLQRWFIALKCEASTGQS
jgi:hypothetical protein